MVVTPDGRRAISASGDRTLKVWNLATGAAERTLIGHDDWVEAVAVTPDGQRVISASRNGILKVWNLATGIAEHTLTEHSDSGRVVAVTPDGRRVISAAYDTLKVLNLVTGQRLASITLEAKASSAAVAPDGMTIVAGDVAGNVYCLSYHEPGAAAA